jgi:ribosome biogenesis GTPase
MINKQPQIARVIKCTRNQYQVDVNGRTIVCNIRGKLFDLTDKDLLSVKVGDEVSIHQISASEGIIEKVLERRSKLSRAVEGKAYREHVIATNIDQIMVIMSTMNPSFKSGLLDRYLIIAEKNNIPAKVVINKIDLSEKENFEIYQYWYARLGYPLFFTSAKNGTGKNNLISMLKDKTSIVVGHSGVGKSSLIKSIQPGLDLKVAKPSNKSKKGIHTTSAVQLFSLSFGGYIIDTPGIKDLGLWGIFKDDLQNYFVEFAKFTNNCQFKDCSHLVEPGCRVKTALESGEIFWERYHNYKNIYQTLRNTPYELIKFR